MGGLSQQVTHRIAVDAFKYFFVVVVGVRLNKRHAVKIIATQSVKGCMHTVAKVKSCIMATVSPVRHKVNSNKPLATLTAALKWRPLYLSKFHKDSWTRPSFFLLYKLHIVVPQIDVLHFRHIARQFCFNGVE